MFRAVERQALPDHLELVVEALEEHAEITATLAPPVRARRKTVPAG
jgi:hypothetical protein